MLLLLQNSFQQRTVAASRVILLPTLNVPDELWSASTSARSPIYSAGSTAADSAAMQARQPRAVGRRGRIGPRDLFPS